MNRIIAAFPGMGKTYYAEHSKNKVYDLELKNFDNNIALLSMHILSHRDENATFLIGLKDLESIFQVFTLCDNIEFLVLLPVTPIREWVDDRLWNRSFNFKAEMKMCGEEYFHQAIACTLKWISKCKNVCNIKLVITDDYLQDYLSSKETTTGGIDR